MQLLHLINNEMPLRNERKQRGREKEDATLYQKKATPYQFNRPTSRELRAEPRNIERKQRKRKKKRM